MIEYIKEILWRSYNGDADVEYNQVYGIFKIKLVEKSSLSLRDLYTIIESKKIKINKIYAENNSLAIEVEVI